MRISIIGATGYTGQELIRLISNHPEAELTYCTSNSYAGMAVNQVLPHLSNVDLPLFKYEADKAKQCDLVFIALPHTKSMPVVKELFGSVPVIDLGGDFRLKDRKVYETWYKTDHEAPELLGKAVYGLAELNKELLKDTQLVANPGCYATASVLALLPLAKDKLLKEVIIDAKSGISGAGKEPSDKNIFGKINENFMPYSVDSHKHQPEIGEALKTLDANFGHVNLTPHLIPIDRGILCSAYAFVDKSLSLETVSGLYEEFYSDKPFVNMLKKGTTPEVKSVRGTNRCDIALAMPEPGLLKVFSVIDNLIKGAAGQAVQNMNVMFGLDETSGLPLQGMVP